MKDKESLAQPETNFQIRYPWIPQTPINQILAKSNAISVDRNGNQSGRSNSGELIGQLERRFNQMSNSNRTDYNFVSSGSLNHSGGSYSITNPMMGNRSLTGPKSSSVSGTLLQSSGSYDMSNQQIRDRSLRVGNNFNLIVPMNQKNSSSSSIFYMGHYLNSQTQTYRNDIQSWSNSHAASNRGLMGNAIQEPSLLTTKMPSILVQKTDPMVSTPNLNVNMQTLNSPWAMSSPRTMNLQMDPPNAPLILNSYAELDDSSWTAGNFTSLLLGNGIPDICQNKSLNLNNSPQMLNNVFHVPEQQNYNLNSPARHGGNAGTSSATPFPFAPITPDHTKLLEKHQQSQMLKFLVDDGSCQEHDKMENFFSSVGQEATENHCSELLQTIVDSAAAVVPRPEPDNNISKERGEQDVIDLNETPKQKAPRRRKHIPKVVTEGKPKRTPKPKTPETGKSENPSRKRKYVRKNSNPKVENGTPQQTNVTDTIKVVNSESRKESCRKRLNFDFEKAEQGESQFTTAKVQVAHHQGNKPVPDLNLNFTANHMPVKSLAGHESCASVAPSGIINHGTLDVVARDLSMRENKIQKKRNIHGELKRNISRANLKLERTKEVRWKSTHQMVERDVGNFKGFCGSGEESHPIEQVGTSSHHKVDSPSMCEGPIGSRNQEPISPKAGNSSEETRKKQKVANDQTKLCGPEKAYCTNGNSNGSKIDAEKYMQSKLTANQQVLLERRERMSSRLNQVRSIGYLETMTNSNLQSAVTPKEADKSAYQQETENHQDGNHKTGLNVTANPCREVSFCKNKVSLQKRKDGLHQNGQLSPTTRGQPKALKYSKKIVDKITLQLRSLSIRCESGETDGKDKYALVPYEGGGALVPYEPKKHIPRPKVDLDPETTRIWKLLMGKEGTEASEAENRDKEKWWKEERRVFQGRADSFIARMHLVQGDRRFSPWKGSVVDSIIGVFLTQNVSDQLSSSAFMALAAKFPLSSATPDQGSVQSGTSILTEEPEIQGLAPYGTLQCLRTERMDLAAEPNRMTQQKAGSSLNSSDSSVHHINGEIQSSSRSSSEAEDTSKMGKSTNKSLFFNRSMHHYKKSAELDYSKQIQGLDRVNNLNSFSLLNHPNNSSIPSMQNSATPLSFFELLMAPQVTRRIPDCFEISKEECRSSFPPRAPEITRRESIGYQNNRIGHATEMMSYTHSQQIGLQTTQTPPDIDPFTYLTNHQIVQKSSIHQVPQTGPLFLNTHQVETYQANEFKHIGSESVRGAGQAFITRKKGTGNQDPNVLNHIGHPVGIQNGTTKANNQVFSSDKSSDGHPKGKVSFSGETSNGISAKTSNTSQKHEKVKSDSFDWDSLRKMVRPNGRGKERSLDASDSMDYEAMRCADVEVISNSIRIRGMNNMLSERIKGFLNRVVTDHGSIDLEWLRDVPPDKTKDYLLSIKGLGLKSVECVRLLTLHHLAFPVDTNVGRIAVRLGWVPLQPLPESLQLHLLEMYPVLESVQKYLWPRLCKLDQKTLYELHYQLITFGKVFCTKSKPNCNACPMRGECRHFASAFASARLALPAPEEKGIVGSTTPIATNGRSNLATKPMLLQPSGSNGEKEVPMSSCEPIIEEPATPEPEITEIAETDMEDTFYEDPDEIPTITLNVEQLADNIRNFMDENMNMQEGDMSKALVALTPEVASIPAPKLKYVLRLRTERQVYVLPDTHPLLEGLDKREPDDPSPYLFALLAPGEEASSGYPSGKCCESNKSRELCNEKDCSSVNGEEISETVRGTLLIPCRTAMQGSFPLNGTYFQVNEVFADHESSTNPIDVPRAWLWDLETRTVLFGTSATSIFRGMTTREIQNSFWRGFVCVRGFDRKTRAPRPLNRNLHVRQSKTVKTGNAA